MTGIIAMAKPDHRRGTVIGGGVLPAIFVKERYYQHRQDADADPLPAWAEDDAEQSVRLLLTGIILTTGLGSGLVGSFGMYVIFYYIKGSDTKSGTRAYARRWRRTSRPSAPSSRCR